MTAYFFYQQVMVFSHNKLMNNTFNYDFLDQHITWIFSSLCSACHCHNNHRKKQKQQQQRAFHADGLKVAGQSAVPMDLHCWLRTVRVTSQSHG
jgi:hypothetical protein